LAVLIGRRGTLARVADHPVDAVGALLADDPALAGVDADDLLALVLRSAGAVSLPPGARVFCVGCGAGALAAVFLLGGAQVGGVDDREPLVAIARDVMPDGDWSVGDPAALDPGEPWDYVVAAGLFARYREADARRGLVARMAAKAAAAVLLFDVGPDPEVGDAWILRAFAEVGASGVQFLHDDDPTTGRTRSHVLVATGG
jgi:hypothetical protein